jgi:hypothetical protein
MGIMKAREAWPRTAKVYCHRVDGGWPEDTDVLQQVPVRVCERRRVAIDLVLDRGREEYTFRFLGAALAYAHAATAAAEQPPAGKP